MMKRALAELLYAPFRMARILEQKARSLRYRSMSTVASTARFLEGSSVVNKRGRSAIRIGGNTSIRGELLVFAHGGQIQIGKWCYLGEGSRIWSANEIFIGNRVLISHNVNIFDNNSHPKDAVARHRHYKSITTTGHPKEMDNISSAPVVIGDDVWIGFGAVILKGVSIGERSIIGAGSFITKDVPQGTTIVGNQF